MAQPGYLSCGGCGALLSEQEIAEGVPCFCDEDWEPDLDAQFEHDSQMDSIGWGDDDA